MVCVLLTHSFAVVFARNDLMLCPRLDRKAGQAIVSSCMQKGKQQHHAKDQCRKAKLYAVRVGILQWT